MAQGAASDRTGEVGGEAGARHHLDLCAKDTPLVVEAHLVLVVKRVAFVIIISSSRSRRSLTGRWSRWAATDATQANSRLHFLAPKAAAQAAHFHHLVRAQVQRAADLVLRSTASSSTSGYLWSSFGTA